MNSGKDVTFYKGQFYKIAKKVLAKYPNELSIFEKYWDTENYRAACAFYYAEMPDFERENLTSEEKEIDIQFYWLFLN